VTSLPSGSNVASRKIGGEKCLISGKKHYFVWDTASQNTKLTINAKNLGESTPLALPGNADSKWVCY